jgi:two-component system response regulator AtoC
LVIDDEADWRSLYRVEFSDRFVVVEAADGRDGLDKLTRVEPDLVIVDLSMPVMDGAQFLACLRARGDATPVIVCTAFRPDAESLAARGVPVVSKSSDLSALSDAVNLLAPVDCL